ncbi:unnamed protein product [Ambrosiozyma monospora]|uniref:Unnamed protein product n=1 Tax=Ambrosiozyma monospora TaxID=43982 RepID=A0ACB5SUP1_AMBMO|nr:unnamed protein product [Ambrosiozyma monospora]
MPFTASILDSISFNEKHEFEQVYNAVPFEIQTIISKFCLNGALDNYSDFMELMIGLGYQLNLTFFARGHVKVEFLLDDVTVGALSNYIDIHRFSDDQDLAQFPINKFEMHGSYFPQPVGILDPIIERARSINFISETPNDLAAVSQISNKFSGLTMKDSSEVFYLLQNIPQYYSLQQLEIDVVRDSEPFVDGFKLETVELICSLIPKVFINFNFFVEPKDPSFFEKICQIKNLKFTFHEFDMTSSWIPYIDILIEKNIDISRVVLMKNQRISNSTLSKLVHYNNLIQLKILNPLMFDGIRFTAHRLHSLVLSGAFRNCSFNQLSSLNQLHLYDADVDLETLRTIPDSVEWLILILKPSRLVSAPDKSSTFFKSSLPIKKKLSFPFNLHHLCINSPTILDTFKISSAPFLKNLAFRLFSNKEFIELAEEDSFWDVIPLSVDKISIFMPTSKDTKGVQVANFRVGKIQKHHTLDIEIKFVPSSPPSLIYLNSKEPPSKKLVNQMSSSGNPCLFISGVDKKVNIQFYSNESFDHNLIITRESPENFNILNKNIPIEDLLNDPEYDRSYNILGFKLIKRYPHMVLFKMKH